MKKWPVFVLLLTLALVCWSCDDQEATQPTDQGSDDAARSSSDAEMPADLGPGDAAVDELGPDASDLIAGPPIVKVLSFNVLCSLCAKDEYDPWKDRLPFLKEVIKRHDADLMGIQELMLASEVPALIADHPVYSTVFFEKSAEHPLDYPDVTIYFRTSRFTLLESGSFWLSPTPDVPYSTGFATPQLARLLYWAKLQDHQSNRTLFFATTHFDNNSPSQELSAPLCLERLPGIVGDEPLILVGDFNSTPSDEAYATLTADGGAGFQLIDAFVLANQWEAVSNTTPEPDYDPERRIDHIFFVNTSTKNVLGWQVDLYKYGANNRFPSDHWPIVSTFEY